MSWRADVSLEAAAAVESFLDALSSCGVKDLIHHTWRSGSFTDETNEATCLALDPERLQRLIREAHARAIRVILCLNIDPAQTVSESADSAQRRRATEAAAISRPLSAVSPPAPLAFRTIQPESRLPTADGFQSEIPEERKTVWYRRHDGARWRTGPASP